MTSKGVRNVVLDTNALMMPFQFNINLDIEIRRLLGQVDILVPTSVLEELERLPGDVAKGARALAARYRSVPVDGRGDAGVLEAARRLDAAVVTNDQELIQLLRKSSVPVIRMRECQYLVFVD